MAEEGSNIAMLSSKRFRGGEDIETGSNKEYVTDIEKNSSSIESPREKTDGDIADIDEWATTLSMTLDNVTQYMCRPGHPGRISRIPQNLREIDEKAYEPHCLSIGPYHHGKPMVQQMEKRKCSILKCVLEKRPNITLKVYLEEIKSIEQEARRFYADTAMESENFARMLLLDSLFILTVFCGVPDNRERVNQTSTRKKSSVDTDNTKEKENKVDRSIGSEDDNENIQVVLMAEDYADNLRWFWPLFEHDLFLLENQIPFFVLERIHALAYGGTKTQLICLLKYRISSLFSCYTKPDSYMMVVPTEEIHHLLQLCHLLFRPTVEHEPIACQPHESGEMFRLGSAVQLYEAGVSFEARSGLTQHSLLDITFVNSGKLVMPCLPFDDNTNSLIRNLIALEQMKYPSLGLHISAYAVLLLHLATTPQDVELLRRKGIIQHHLASDKEMVYLINRVSVGLSFDYVEDSYSLKPVFHELKRYAARRVPRWRVLLKHRYFRNPWTVISLFAALFLILISFVQTYYAVYSYYYPPR